MSLNEFEKAYLNDYAITLRDSADRDYISARAMYTLEIDDKASHLKPKVITLYKS